MPRTTTVMTPVVVSSTGGIKEGTLGVHSETFYGVSGVLTADGPTTIYSGPCLLYGIQVTAALSAHITVIKDGTTAVLVVPASAANGTVYQYPGVRFETSLIVDPDDATTTGNLTLFYKPL